MKRNMIICKFELRLTNSTTLVIATPLPSKSYKKAVFFSNIRRKVMTLFKCLQFVESFAATYSSHSLLINAQASF